MAKPLLTIEQKEYLIEIAPGRFTEEITRMINDKFGMSLTAEQIHRYKSVNKIHNGMQHKYKPVRSLLTMEQEEFLKGNIKGRYNGELAQMLNDRFDLNLTADQLKAYRTNHKIFGKSGLTGRFEKGHESDNKGKKFPGRGDPATVFKAGHRPQNAVPAGTLITRADGYIWEKIAEPNKWRQKHVLVWEAAHGKRPKGTKIVFADQNRNNLSLDNLILVTDSELAIANQKKLIFKDAQLTKSGMIVAKVMAKINKRKKVAK